LFVTANKSRGGAVYFPERSNQPRRIVMKRIGIGIVALGLSLSALTLGSKAANAAEPCAPVVSVQPAGYYGPVYGYRARDIRYREHLRWEREQARIRWARDHRFYRGY
jgi:hypothetical protein